MNILTTYSEDFKSDLILSDVLIFFDYQYRSIDMIRRFDNNQQFDYNYLSVNSCICNIQKSHSVFFTVF